MNRFLLYGVVATSGAVVLAMEILGTRILGPYYGVSLYLWSALITVTLMSLSLGYLLGGRWADRSPKQGPLVVILTGAGLWLLAIPFIKIPLLVVVQPLGQRLALMIAGLLLFAPALTLLGMVGPFAIKLRTLHLREVGRTAGDLYAISTIASVAAALLTGFFLIPYFGVQRLTLTCGALLLATAVLVAGWSARGKAAALLILFIVSGLMIFSMQHPPAGHLAHRASAYGDVRVVDRDSVRYLLIDGGVHSAVQLPELRTVMPYAAAAELLKYFFTYSGDMLLIGLGGGCIARSFADDGWRLKVAEIDPVVTDFAFSYFGLPRDAVNVAEIDGRAFLVQCKQTFDLIVVDAFGSSSIPFHLTTREAFKELKDHLNREGILCVNVETVGWRHPLVNSLARTLKSQFPIVIALPTAEPPDAAGNVLLVASERSLVFPENWLGNPFDYLYDEYLHWAALQRNHAWDNRFSPDTTGAAILTDDRNPSDLMAEDINAAVRPLLREQFGPMVW